jgi:hypothetical protein
MWCSRSDEKIANESGVTLENFHVYCTCEFLDSVEVVPNKECGRTAGKRGTKRIPCGTHPGTHQTKLCVKMRDFCVLPVLATAGHAQRFKSAIAIPQVEGSNFTIAIRQLFKEMFLPNHNSAIPQLQFFF